VKVASESSNYDVNNQTNQLDNFIASGANVILLNAADSKGIAPAVMRAKSAGITVIAIDVGAEGGVDATITSNNSSGSYYQRKCRPVQRLDKVALPRRFWKYAR
jgi:ribose transport system substrate-binding protein